MSFLSCLCYITDENEHIQTGLESKASPSPSFPEHTAGAGEER